MKIYVACHDVSIARIAASALRDLGHAVTSRWLQEPFLKTEEYTVEDRQRIAAMDLADVAEADALLLIAGPDKYSGGKFVETGFAMGLGKTVYVLGHRENMLLWDKSIRQIDGLAGIT